MERLTPAIRQAVISAGGLGTRLRPLTDTMPKPMIPILGKPLLEWHIEQFKKSGVTEFFFTLHHLPEVVMGYFGDGSTRGITIRYVVEKEPLGSAGALKEFEDMLDQTFYYTYGDIFSLMDYSKMAEVYAEKDAPIGMQRTKRTGTYHDADVAELDAEGRFRAVHAKPHTEVHPNAHRMRGAFILDKKILSYLPRHSTVDFGRELLSTVIAAGENFYGYECDDYSKGIDTQEKINEVLKYLRTHPHP